MVSYFNEMLAKLSTFQTQKRLVCRVKRSDLAESVLKILRKNQYIYGYKFDGPFAVVYLRYHKGGPIISRLKPESRGRSRKYVGKKTRLSSFSTETVRIVESSTARGVVEMANLAHRGVYFGELVCSVW